MFTGDPILINSIRHGDYSRYGRVGMALRHGRAAEKDGKRSPDEGKETP